MSVVPYYNTSSRDVGNVSSGFSHRGSSVMPTITSYPSEGGWKRDSFDNDLFGSDVCDNVFSRTRGLFGQMDRMMSSMMRDPFGGDPFYRGASFPSLMAPPTTSVAPHTDPFGYSNFGTLMPSMVPDAMAREAACHSYSSSSVVSMTTGPDGRPQVYQASSSTRGGPGGVRETHRTVADSTSGMRKMAIGHHIGDRSHVIEKEMRRDGDLEERQEFVNLDEEEAPDFDREFRRRSHHQPYPALEHRPRNRTDRPSTSSPSRQRYLPALPASSRTSDSYRRRTRPSLAIASGSSRADERTRHRERGSTRIRRQQ